MRDVAVEISNLIDGLYSDYKVEKISLDCRIMNGLVFENDYWAIDLDSKCFALKIIDISLWWNGEDEEKIPQLKRIRTLSGVIVDFYKGFG